MPGGVVEYYNRVYSIPQAWRIERIEIIFYFPPQTGLEPVTNRLTADRSTTELLRINS